MGPEVAAVICACIAAVASIVAARVGRKAEIVSRRAEQHSRQAAQNTRPISNGFASSVTDALDRIEDRQMRTEHLLMDHLSDHASADVRRHNLTTQRRESSHDGDPSD